MQVFSQSGLQSASRSKIMAKSSFLRKDSTSKINTFLKYTGGYSTPSSLSYRKPSPTLQNEEPSLSKNTPLDIEKQLSLIADPLWKRVCSEIVHFMGPMAIQVFQVELGLPQEKSIDLYCNTEELVRFIHTYNFIVLASLQRYFPSLKALNIQTQSKEY